jgi:hypothetical protein
MAGRQRHQPPKTLEQPEEKEANSKRSRACGNNASTGISRVPPTLQQMRRPTSDRQDARHVDAGMTTASARTKDPVGVRTGRPRPADSEGHSRPIAAPEHEDARHTPTAGRSDRSCDPALIAARDLIDQELDSFRSTAAGDRPSVRFGAVQPTPPIDSVGARSSGGGRRRHGSAGPSQPSRMPAQSH